MTVILGERSEYTGEVIGIDEGVDLAVIKIEPAGELPTLVIGDSSDVAVGDDVTALGFPLGSLLSLSQKSELVIGMSLGVPSKRHQLGRW